MKKRALSLLLMGWCFAHTAQAFSLSQAWDAARQHSADYLAAEFNRDAELEREKQAKASLLPQLSANASYQRQPQSLSASKITQGWNVQLSQTLYDGAKWAQYRQSKLNTQSAQAELGYHQDDLLLKVSESYFNVLLAQDTIRATHAEREAYLQQLKQAQELFKRGAATAVDIHEAQAGYDNAVAKEVEALTQKQLAENQLANYTGYDPLHIAPVNMSYLKQRIPQQIKRHSLQQWQNLALQHNREYQVALFQSKGAQEGVNIAKANRLPKVSAYLGYQNNHYKSYYGDDSTGKGLTAGVQVSVPLYTGGDVRSRIREAAARLGEAESRLLSVERKVKLAVKQAYTENNTAHYQILAQERVLSSSQLKLKSTRTGKDFGIRTNMEVIDAQREVADAQQKLAQSQYRYLQSFLTLVKEGGLDVQAEWLAVALPSSGVKSTTVGLSPKRQAAKIRRKKR